MYNGDNPSPHLPPGDGQGSDGVTGRAFSGDASENEVWLSQLPGGGMPFRQEEGREEERAEDDSKACWSMPTHKAILEGARSLEG